MVTDSFVDFLYEGNLPQLYFSHANLKEVKFESRRERLKFSIAPVKHKLEMPSRNLKYRVKYTTNIDSKYIDVIDGIKNNLFVKTDDSKINLPHLNRDKILIETDGKIPGDQNYWFEYLPDNLQNAAINANRICSEAFSRFLRIICWTQNIQFPLASSELYGALYWRTKRRGNYYYVPSKGQIGNPISGSSKNILWTTVEQERARSIWIDKSKDVPLSQELIREAAELVNISPRSALVMAFSAIEIGVKNFITLQIPKSEWLVENLSSPPVSRIFRKYLQTLDNKSQFSADIYNKISNKIQKIEEIRNKITHTGSTVNSQEVYNIVNEIKSLLYFLDYLSGQVWAAEFAPENIVNILNVKSSRGRKLTLRYRTGPFI